MGQLHDLHNQIMHAKALSNRLKGLLCANSYRNTENSKVVHLKNESRKWHTIRLSATQSRKLAILGNTGAMIPE
ncbi:MAG: hypothetical protein G8237_04985 [Magnetococcales bacterium]|nr:hypothetical protein [Magnetococcales bacterium]